jgi:uncharacterized protein YjdB
MPAVPVVLTATFEEDTTPVTGVSIVGAATRTMTVGTTLQLEEVVAPSDATDDSVTWASADTAIATVSATGLVTAVAVGGPVDITVTTVDGGHTATVAVTVVPPAVENVTIAGPNGVIAGQNITLTATVAPAGANQAVTWETSDAAIATVNNGVVTGVAPGAVVITARSVEDNTIYGTHNVTVTAAHVYVTGVSITGPSNVLIGTTIPLAAVVTPAYATNPAVTWASSDTAIATVNADGVVTGVAVGDATITVTTVEGGYTATHNVEVTAITFSPPWAGGGGRARAVPREQRPPVDPGLSLTVRGGDYVVDEEATAEIIEDALEAGDNVVITLPANASAAQFFAESIRDIVDARASLAVYQDGVRVIFTWAALDGAVPAGTTDLVEVAIRPVPYPAIDRVQGVMEEDGRDPESLVRIATITMRVGTRNVNQFAVPISIGFNVTGRDVLAEDSPATFRLEAGDNKSFFGGTLAAAWFDIRTDRLSTYGFMRGVDLNSLRFVIDSTSFTRNNVPVLNDVAPFIEDGRTLVPLRAVAEGFGANVWWEPYTQTANMTLDGQHISLVIGVMSEGLDVPARLIDNRTFVPLRYVSEVLGSNVVWDSGARAAYIFREN